MRGEGRKSLSESNLTGGEKKATAMEGSFGIWKERVKQI